MAPRIQFAHPAVIERKFKELDGSARATIRLAEAKAEDKLIEDVTGFIQECWTGAVLERLKRIPRSTDLTPYFESYALAIFNGVAAGLLHIVDSDAQVDDYVRSLEVLTEAIVRTIIEKKGLWRRVIAESCKDTNFGGYESAIHGEYGPRDFSPPPPSSPRVIGVALRKSLRRWRQQVLSDLSGATNPGNDFVDKPGKVRGPKMYKTALARNIDRYRRECGWGFETLAEKSGMGLEHIKDHVYRGKQAQGPTLRVYADTFSKRLEKEITIEMLEA